MSKESAHSAQMEQMVTELWQIFESAPERLTMSKELIRLAEEDQSPGYLEIGRASCRERV